jgi:hypothetical protein
VEELVKQNSSLETLSKGQEQALAKKEKQLQVTKKTVAFLYSLCFRGAVVVLRTMPQDAIEDLAEMKRIQDAIFNLSKSRQTAGSCS